MDDHQDNDGQLLLDPSSPSLDNNTSLVFKDFTPSDKRARCRRNLFSSHPQISRKRRKTLPASNPLGKLSTNNIDLPLRENQSCRRTPHRISNQHASTCPKVGFRKTSGSSQSVSHDSSASVVPRVGLKDKEIVMCTIIKVRNSAVKENGPLLTAARFIVNFVVRFLKSRKGTVCKEDVVNFLKGAVLISPEDLATLDEGKSSQQETTEKARECEFQIFLNLAVEAAFPTSPHSSSSVDTIILLLRSLLSAASQERVLKFIQELTKQKS